MFSSYIYPKVAHLMSTLLPGNKYVLLPHRGNINYKNELLDILRHKKPFRFLHQLLIPY